MADDYLIPQRGDTWVHVDNSAVRAEVLGRSGDRVLVESEGSFIEGKGEFPVHLFVRHFRLLARPS